MTEHGVPPEVFGNAATSWGYGFFQMRVQGTDSIPHLRAAVKAEANGQARKKRIAILNRRIQKVNE